MKQSILNLLMVVILVVLFVTAQSVVRADGDCPVGEWNVNGQCVIPAEAALHEGWNLIKPMGETACAHGTPYMFWVRPGGDNLLMYFEGGGGCWNAETCQVGSTWYNQTVNESDINGARDGIFDFDNPENPFADYTTVYAPSCTGDVYMGAQVTDYSDDMEIYHHGFINGSAAMDWIFATIEAPQSIFVTGCSAGSVGSIIFAPRLAEQYPDVPLYQWGDSLGAIFAEANDLASIWGAEASIPDWISDAPSADAFQMSAFYNAVANYYPDAHFAQYNTQYDNVQQRYFSIGASDPSEVVREKVDEAMQTISADAPNFHYFVQGGDVHCITPRSQFYSYASNGVRLRDWVAAYANGEDVDSVHCADCESAERISD